MPAVFYFLCLVVVIVGIFLFNRLIADRNRVRAAWSDVDVQLTRRYDLVPMLVSAVDAYAGHERATLEAVTELRTQAAAADKLVEKAGYEAALEAGVQKLLVLAEAYPDLKANENFLELQKDLVGIEDHLQYARRFYNGSVRILNTRIETFPDLFLAKMFNIGPAEFFEASNRDAPEVRV